MENAAPDEFHIPHEHLARLNDPEVLRRYVEEGKTFQEILEFDEKTMQDFYRVARNLLDRNQSQDAVDAFLFLTTLNPFVSAYWVGLGMCEQLQEEYKRALVAYAMAQVTDRTNPIPQYYSAACHHALGETDRALTCLEKAIEDADEYDAFASVKMRALIAQKALLEKRPRPTDEM